MPVCPLCNVPIPVKRGEIPDVVVGEHMDRDCTFHPGKNQKKVRAGLGLAHTLTETHANTQHSAAAAAAALGRQHLT